MDEARDLFNNMEYSKFKPNEVMDTFRYIYPDTDSIYSIDEMMMYIHGTSK